MDAAGLLAADLGSLHQRHGAQLHALGQRSENMIDPQTSARAREASALFLGNGVKEELDGVQLRLDADAEESVLPVVEHHRQEEAEAAKSAAKLEEEYDGHGRGKSALQQVVGAKENRRVVVAEEEAAVDQQRIRSKQVLEGPDEANPQGEGEEVPSVLEEDDDHKPQVPRPLPEVSKDAKSHAAEMQRIDVNARQHEGQPEPQEEQIQLAERPEAAVENQGRINPEQPVAAHAPNNQQKASSIDTLFFLYDAEFSRDGTFYTSAFICTAYI